MHSSPAEASTSRKILLSQVLMPLRIVSRARCLARLLQPRERGSQWRADEDLNRATSISGDSYPRVLLRTPKYSIDDERGAVAIFECGKVGCVLLWVTTFADEGIEAPNQVLEAVGIAFDVAAGVVRECARALRQEVWLLEQQGVGGVALADLAALRL